MADDSVPAGLLPEPEEPLYEEDLDEEEAEAEGEDDGLELEIMDPDHVGGAPAAEARRPNLTPRPAHSPR